MNKIIKQLFTPGRFGIRLMTAINLTFLTLFLLLVIYVGLAPSQNKFNLYQSAIAIFIAAGALITLVIYILNVRFTSRRIARVYPYLVALLLVGSFLVQLFIAKALESTGYTWDSQQIFNQASNYALNGSIEIGYVNYILDSPNNIGLLAGLGIFFKTLHNLGFDNFLTAAILLNIVLMSITQVILYLVAKMLYGRRVGLISILFGFIFISLSMYVHIPYTDTLTIIFPISILYLSLQIVKTQNILIRFLLGGLLGAIATIGYLIKPTVAIALIAVVLAACIWFILKNKHKNVKATLTMAIGSIVFCALGILGTYAGYIKVVDSSHILPFPVARASENGLPLVHFMAIGTITNHFSNTTNYGGYDDRQANIVAALPTEQEKVDYSIKTIEKNIQDYGPLGYINFLTHKANWILSDGTFYAYGEGSNANVRFSHNDATSQFIRQFTFVNGRYYMLFANILQVFWLCILLLISMQLIIVVMNKSSRQNLYIMIPRLMLAGILLFLLLFEGRARYLYLYVPIFIIVAMYTLRWFQDKNSATINSAKTS